MKLPHKIAVYYRDDTNGGKLDFKYVPGLVLPGMLFGITEYNGYGLTHIPSGRLVIRIRTKAAGKRLAKILQSQPIDWNYTDPMEFNKWPAKVRSEIAAACEEHRYK